MVDATEVRVMNKWMQLVGETVLLENGSERYYILFKQMGKRVATNMKFCKWIEGGWNWFYNYVSIDFDRATACKPDKIREILLFWIKYYLNLSNETEYYINPHGILFKFKSFFIIVSQEIQHIYIRARKIKMWKFHHSDQSLIRLNWQTVVKGCTVRYDEFETPPVLIDEKEAELRNIEPKYHPYNLIDNKIELLQNREKCDAMCEIVQNIWKLTKTYSKILIDELKRKIHFNKMVSWLKAKECLMNILKWSPSRYLTCVLALFLVGWDVWHDLKKEDRWYTSYKAKEKKDYTQGNIPYIIAGESQYRDIINYLHLKTDDYPNKFFPFASVLQMTSAYDSIFMYVFPF